MNDANSVFDSTSHPTSQVAYARLNATRLGTHRKRAGLEQANKGFYLYLFNFDGVLADTLQHYQQAVKVSARTAGAKIVDVPASVLTNAETLDADGLADALKLARAVRPRFASHLEANLMNGLWRCTLFNGVQQLLTTLSSRGYTAVMSRSHSSIIETILRNHGLSSKVHRIIGSEQMGTPDERLEALLRQYNVRPESAIYCGDSVRDINFAHRNGLRSAACTWGWQPKLVVNCDATFTANRTGQLLAQLLAPAGLEPDVAV